MADKRAGDHQIRSASYIPASQNTRKMKHWVKT